MSYMAFLLPSVLPVTELGSYEAQNNYSRFMQLDANKSNRLILDEFYLLK